TDRGHRHLPRGPPRGHPAAGGAHHLRRRPRVRGGDPRPTGPGGPGEPAPGGHGPGTVRRRRRALRRRRRALRRRGRGLLVATIVSYTARPRRVIQAVLLAFAVVIGVGAYALVHLGRFDELPTDLMQYGIGAAVLALALQVAVMWRTPYADPVILPLVVLLNLLGIAVIESVHAANEIYGL